MKHLPSDGFSLIELIVATAITGTLIIIVTSFLSNQLVENAIQNARTNMTREAQLSLDVVNRDIKHAASVDSNNRWADEYAPDGDYSWESDNDVLILASPARNLNEEYLYEDPFAYITHKNNLVYFVEAGTLYKRILPADIEDNAISDNTCPKSVSDCEPDIELINHVSDFSIRYYNALDEEVEPEDARSVAVSLTMSTTVYGRSVEADYSIRSVFRND